MALKLGPFQGRFRTSLLAISDLGSGNRRNALNLRNGFVRFRKWECCRMGVLAQRDFAPVGDEKLGVDCSQTISRTLDESERFHEDLSILPKPRSASGLHSPNDGSEFRVAYQGLPGAYSEIAAMRAYPECDAIPCEDFEDAFKAVESWLVDKAILPIENAVAGSVHRNYDLLLRHSLHIVGEIQMQIHLCLLGLQGVRKEELKCVLSHPHTLDQCEKTINRLGVHRINTGDTAAAAEMVASKGKRNSGAVASARAAKIYGLDILAERFQDDDDNLTRFLILAREPINPGTDKPHKTSIVFALEDRPGVLFKALSVFSLRDIILMKIESRPQTDPELRVVDDSDEGNAKCFDYLFYIDFAASMAEPRAQYALQHLQEFVRFLRVLGCYPVDILD